MIKNIIDTYYLEPFYSSFVINLTLHIKNLFERAKKKQRIKNPLASKVKDTYPLIYDIAVSIAQDLTKSNKIEVNTDEIAFIALHIGACFENNAQKKSKITCAFIYANYYSLYKNAIDIIIDRFRTKLDIKYALSINNYHPDVVETGLIISSIDMHFPVESVILNPILTETDFKRIDATINSTISLKRSRALIDVLPNFFSKSLFYKCPNFKNKNDAIRKMTEDAIQQGYAPTDFFRSVMDREIASNTVFGNVAILHSQERTIKSFISVALCNPPVLWDDKQVKIIALMGLSKESRKLFCRSF